jgi:hypothetical protein
MENISYRLKDMEVKEDSSTHILKKFQSNTERMVESLLRQWMENF